MSRTFLSLYSVVVLSILAVGWGADRLWQVLGAESDMAPLEIAFFDLVDERLQRISEPDDDREKIVALTNITGRQIELFNVGDLASSTLRERIIGGVAVTINDPQGNEFVYSYLPRSDKVIRVLVKENSRNYRSIYLLLLIGFYSVIALAIYFWIWPLSRDLRILKKHTEYLGSGSSTPVQLNPQSAIYSLASAFNKMTQRINDLLASNKEMTYAVSHELRTPLARMKFALEMAKDARDQRQVMQQIQNLHDDVTQMDRLINELLVYARYDHYDTTLEQQYGDLLALVDTVVAYCKSIHKEKPVDCRIDDQLGGQYVSCEWYLMERCINNVIENAFKYSSGLVQVSLKANDTQYCICVEDNGPGIPEKDIASIFKAFVRLRSEEPNNIAGFGLGLAIVHRIMKWHGGRVGVMRSKLGGARFELIWPRLEAHSLSRPPD